MSTQRDLFTKLCPPGTDPIEDWVIRLSASPLNLTAKTLGLYVGWHAYMHGTPVYIVERMWEAANLRVWREHDRTRMGEAIRALEGAGFIRLIYGRDLPSDQLQGRAASTIVGFHLTVVRSQ